MEWILQLPILFFSVVVHEFCHGWAALERGDDTAQRAGRLTLDPLAHVDPFGTVFLPALCLVAGAPVFAWAKPVPVNPLRLKRPVRDMVSVALVGPAANLSLALGAALAFKLASLASFLDPGLRATLLEALLFGVTINLFLAFFNLIPVHPLDGSQVMGGLLPDRLARLYDRHMPYGMFIILALMFTKASAVLVLWPSEQALSLLVRVGLLAL